MEISVTGTVFVLVVSVIGIFTAWFVYRGYGRLIELSKDDKEKKQLQIKKKFIPMYVIIASIGLAVWTIIWSI